MKVSLLVTNNKEYQEIIPVSLKNNNIYTIIASSAEEAIDNLKKIKYDLIIYDNNIGINNGTLLLKYVRNNNDNVKFIILDTNKELEGDNPWKN